MPQFFVTEVEMIGFVLVLFRILAFVIAWPVFGVSSVPSQAKVLIGIVLSFLMFPVIQSSIPQLEMTEMLILHAAREILIGLILGYITRLFFFAISMGGMLIAVSMGLGAAQLMNPTIGEQGNSVEQYQVALATLLFLAINGHYLFLTGLSQSFTALPVGTLSLNIAGFSGIAMLGQEVIEIGIKMAAPIMISVFLSNLAMGIVGRAVPQINVFITSIPVTIVLGFAILLVSVPLFLEEMSLVLEIMTERLFETMKAI